MPRCRVCRKNFTKISDLAQHHKSVHPGVKFVSPQSSISTKLVVSMIVVIIAVGALVGVLILYTPPADSPTTTTQSGILGQGISDSMYSALTTVSDSTLTIIGAPQGVTKPTLVTGDPLILGGKPGVLYVGSEYCPFCAAETWSLAIALSKFGTFYGLKYMLSSPTDVYANTNTFSFHGAEYTSQYITFVGVEETDRFRQPIEQLTQDQSNILQKYDACNPNCSLPFIDIGNKYVLIGSQFSPSIIQDQNWSSIASQLSNPNSNIAKSILGAANYLVSAICNIDGGQPSSVCSNSYAQLLGYSSSSTLYSQISIQYKLAEQERKSI